MKIEDRADKLAFEIANSAKATSLDRETIQRDLQECSFEDLVDIADGVRMMRQIADCDFKIGSLYNFDHAGCCSAKPMSAIYDGEGWGTIITAQERELIGTKAAMRRIGQWHFGTAGWQSFPQGQSTSTLSVESIFVVNAGKKSYWRVQ